MPEQEDSEEEAGQDETNAGEYCCLPFWYQLNMTHGNSKEMLDQF